jgi:hypothetical protein
VALEGQAVLRKQRTDRVRRLAGLAVVDCSRSVNTLAAVRDAERCATVALNARGLINNSTAASVERRAYARGEIGAGGIDRLTPALKNAQLARSRTAITPASRTDRALVKTACQLRAAKSRSSAPIPPPLAADVGRLVAIDLLSSDHELESPAPFGSSTSWPSSGHLCRGTRYELSRELLSTIHEFRTRNGSMEDNNHEPSCGREPEGSQDVARRGCEHRASLRGRGLRDVPS